GTHVARGDVNGDGTLDIVTGAGPGGGPDVRQFRPDGSLIRGFFAYSAGFHGGVDVAACDFDGDGKAEILTGPGPGGGPDVRVFRSDGTLLKSFFAYAGGFSGGVNVSCADVNGDGKAEILTGPGAGGGPDVRVFASGPGLGGGPNVRTFDSSGTLLSSFFSLSPSMTNGLDVGAGRDGIVSSTWTSTDVVHLPSLS